ncbi:MAG TPA: FliA/WhiG family RNA polymerase sigma factor [Clostridia bacterium]|nr:FliA/WhiG family RNA polymerase sigma factor [Clostridia bacterium]
MANPQFSYASQTVDELERERLLLEHLPEVRYIARRIHDRLPKHVPVDDLISAGVLGLMDAFQKYDAAKHVQFKSYASFRIRGAILDSLRELDWSPRDLRRKARKLEEANNRLSTQLGRMATETELAEDLGMPIEDFHKFLGELDGLDLGSLQAESDSGAGDDQLIEFIAGDPEQSPYVQCWRSELQRALASAIADLPEKQRRVLALYYYEELTMKEVGTVLGIGESRVSQIHSLAVLQLRSRLRSVLGQGTAMPMQTSSQGDACRRY